MPHHSKLRCHLCVITLVAAISLAGLMFAVVRVRAGSLADLPPRPTPVSTSAPDRSLSSSSSSFIVLRTTYPSTWAWHARHWQSLPTQVQWQVASGEWVDVGGWYGAHDDIEVRADGTATAEKTWWIAPEDYGAGPFRWLVLDATDATPLAVSAPFTLPVRSGQTVRIPVELAVP